MAVARDRLVDMHFSGEPRKKALLINKALLVPARLRVSPRSDHRLIYMHAKSGITVKFVESWHLSNVEKALTPKTKIVHIETPSNPRKAI
jgi:cystathionine beta-lyase/cystathionine gamma-synthase